MKKVLFYDFENGEIEEFLKLKLNIKNGFHWTQIYSLNNLKALVKLSTWDLFIGYYDDKDSTFVDIVNFIEKNRLNIPCIACVKQGYKNLNESKISLLNKGVYEVVEVNSHDLITLYVDRTLQNIANFKRLCQIEIERDEERSLRQFLAKNSESAVVHVYQGIVIQANQAFVNLIGLDSIEEVLWMPFLDFIASDGKEEMRKLLADESRLLSIRNTERCNFILSSGDTQLVSIHYSVGNIDGQDCTQMTIKALKNKHEQQNSGHIETDYLTGLANRKRFLKVVDKIIKSPISEHSQDYVVFIKLDRFENTIAEIGLSKSDEVINSLSQLLLKVVGNNLCCARFSEQVFTVLFSAESQDEISNKAKNIVEAFARHIIKFDEIEVTVTVSIGISLVSRNVDSSYTVMSDAHAAYHDAFDAGGNTYRLYKPTTKAKILGNEKQLQMIEYALLGDAMEECYVPFCALRGHDETQYEITARVNGIKSNNLQRLLAKEADNNLSILLDKWVISKALKRIQEHDCERKSIKMFCYLSAASINELSFRKWLKDELMSTKAPLELLNFELDLQTVIDYAQRSRQVADRLIYHGCNVTISNINTEISNHHLKQLLSINFDHAIVNDSTFENIHDPDVTSKIQNLIRILKNEKKIIMARQIKSSDQLMYLWKMRIDYFQNETMLSGANELENDVNNLERNYYQDVIVL
ncbi:MAG: EAL domain-containing protein [Gammaproteobacteria bacterium]|nr:EAL domain-containing protein [Gammaproteobacteria bacterium]